MRRPRFSLRWCTALLSVALPGPFAAVTAQDGPPTPTVVSSSELLEDARILYDALLALHPGLYRYQDSSAFASHYSTLVASLQRGLPLSDAYREITRFVSHIQCGHTYPNYWNQPEHVRDEVLAGSDKLPFAFQFVGSRMIVTHDGTPDGRFPRGTEVLRIDEIPVPEILDTLMMVMHADGANHDKRKYELQVRGVGDFEAFDVLYPLFFPVREGAVSVEYRRPTGGRREDVVRTVTREERRARFASRYGAQPDAYDDQWRFDLLDEGSGYLKLGTFVTWNMELDWRAFLRSAFDSMATSGVTNLILDVRGNEGGDNAVLDALYRYLVSRPITQTENRQLVRYETVPATLAPYLDTWDDSFLDRRGQVTRVDDRFFTSNAQAAGLRTRTIRPRRSAFQGSVYLLIDAANSSATFVLASLLSQHNLATLVGQPTGGSRQGINGGQMVFLRLPHSGIEVDIPLIAYHPPTDQPDAGIQPDLLVVPTAEDVINGADPVLEAVRKLIRSN